VKMIREDAHNLLEARILAFRHSDDRISRNARCG